MRQFYRHPQIDLFLLHPASHNSSCHDEPLSLTEHSFQGDFLLSTPASCVVILEADAFHAKSNLRSSSIVPIAYLTRYSSDTLKASIHTGSEQDSICSNTLNVHKASDYSRSLGIHEEEEEEEEEEVWTVDGST